MASHTSTIVGLVSADWCKYCQKLAPEWIKMKTILEKANFPHELQEFKDINIHVLDKFNRENAEFLHHQKVNNRPVPTIFRIGSSGKIEYYKGDRKAHAMANWFMSKSIAHSAKSATHYKQKHRGGGGGSRRRKTRKCRRTRRRV